MKSRLVFIVMIAITLFSCKKSNDAIIEQTPAQTTNDVAYGVDAKQKMNVYLPAGRSTASTKTIILIHGGAWYTGDKNDADWLPYVDSLKKRLPTYAIFNINYRLFTFGIPTSTNTFPAQENDVKAATDFIYSKRTEYNISDKFVLIGASAGAHLALLQAYKNTTIKVKAVVDLFGPADMVAMHNNPAPAVPAAGIAALLNGTPVSNPTLYQSSSPINFVDNLSSPTIIFHGGVSDTLVRTSQSTALRDKLIQKAVVHQYVLYPSEGHGWAGANLKDTFDKIQAFLNANVL